MASLDARTKDLLIAKGFDPNKLPAGTLVNGKPVGEFPNSDLTPKRPTPGVMNKTEAKYAEQLEAWKLAGSVVAWWFEPFSLKLAERTHYRPDFLVWYATGALVIVEIKGFWRDDAKAKFKIAREKFPCFQWAALRKVKGGWESAI